MERLSAEHFLQQVAATAGFGLVWHPDDEPVIYFDKHMRSRGYLGPDPETTDDVLYSLFLANLRILLGKRYRADNQVSQLVDCEMPLTARRFSQRICWLLRWGHTIHFCHRPRGKSKPHWGDHRCRCNKTWPMTEKEKA